MQPAEDPAAVLSRLANMLAPWALRTAATLGLADLMASGVHSVDELAKRAGADVDALRALLTYLTKEGVFAQEAPDHYVATEVGALLGAEHPASEHSKLHLDGVVGRMDRALAGLLDMVQTGAPAYSTVHGRPFWDDLDAQPHLLASFDGLMRANAEVIGPEVAASYDWPSVSHVTDVGGGSGALVTSLLGGHPHLQATIVDLPATAERARLALADLDIADQINVVNGSFFDPLPAGADAYVLSWILHDWGDADAINILRRCADAAGPDGVVLVVEQLLQDHRQREDLVEMDLRMLVLFGSRERTLEEYRDLGAAAGLELRAASPLTTGRFALLEFGPIDSNGAAEAL